MAAINFGIQIFVFFFEKVVEWSKALVCYTRVLYGTMGSNPILFVFTLSFSSFYGYPLMVNGLPSKQKLWVRFPLPVSFKTFSMSSSKNTFGSSKSSNIVASISPKIPQQTTLFSASRASSRMLPYFVRCGKKEKREGHFRRLIIKRERTIRAVSLTAKGATERGQQSISDLFEPFFLSATPFISLKALRTRRKRRGKRIINKLIPLDRARSERKPFSTLAAILQISGRTPKPFNNRLEHELDSLYNAARPGRDRSGLVSTLREKRDLIHRTAFYSRPRSWKTKEAFKQKKGLIFISLIAQR